MATASTTGFKQAVRRNTDCGCGPAGTSRRAMVAAACVLLTGCDLVTPTNLPHWPDPAAVRAFDLRPVRSDHAVRILDLASSYYGIYHVCGESPVPSGVAFAPGEEERMFTDIGLASYEAVFREVERRYPGMPESHDLAERIWRLMQEDIAKRGFDAAKVQGCAAMRRVQDEFWLALRSWRPVADTRATGDAGRRRNDEAQAARRSPAQRGDAWHWSFPGSLRFGHADKLAALARSRSGSCL